MSEQASTLATARARLLQEVLTVRESAEEAARKEYVASRMRGEQMRAVLERLKTEQALVHTRRSQAEMDDRYLARQRWLQMRGGREAEGLAT
jgi:flagellar biosynthesis chaperone FliJ